jgi:hypothetical protein
MANPYAEKTDEVIAKGGLLAQLYFDIHGKSKNSIENLALSFSSSLKNEKGVVFAISEIEEPIENEDKSYSTFIKVTILFSSFPDLCSLLTRYSPVSMEIIKPDKIYIKQNELVEGLIEISETLNMLKFKLYKEALSQEEKMYIDRIIKIREEIGKNLKKKLEK